MDSESGQVLSQVQPKTSINLQIQLANLARKIMVHCNNVLYILGDMLTGGVCLLKSSAKNSKFKITVHHRFV